MLREWLWAREPKQRKHGNYIICSPMPRKILSTQVDVTRWHFKNDETTRRLSIIRSQKRDLEVVSLKRALLKNAW